MHGDPRSLRVLWWCLTLESVCISRPRLICRRSRGFTSRIQFSTICTYFLQCFEKFWSGQNATLPSSSSISPRNYAYPSTWTNRGTGLRNWFRYIPGSRPPSIASYIEQDEYVLRKLYLYTTNISNNYRTKVKCYALLVTFGPLRSIVRTSWGLPRNHPWVFTVPLGWQIIDFRVTLWS